VYGLPLSPVQSRQQLKIKIFGDSTEEEEEEERKRKRKQQQQHFFNQ